MTHCLHHCHRSLRSMLFPWLFHGVHNCKRSQIVTIWVIASKLCSITGGRIASKLCSATAVFVLFHVVSNFDGHQNWKPKSPSVCLPNHSSALLSDERSKTRLCVMCKVACDEQARRVTRSHRRLPSLVFKRPSLGGDTAISHQFICHIVSASSRSETLVFSKSHAI